MTFKTQAYGSRGNQAAVPLPRFKLVQGLVSGIAGIGDKALARARTLKKSLQMARMMSVLSSMSDDQLVQIGISRSEIPEYAKTLMADE